MLSAKPMASNSLAGQIGDAWNAALLCVRATRQWLATAFSILTGVELAAASAPAEVAPMGVGFGLAPSWSFSAEYNHLSMGGNTWRRQSCINYRLGGYGRH